MKEFIHAYIFHQSKVSFTHSLSSSSNRLHIIEWNSSRLKMSSSTLQSLMPVRKCRSYIIYTRFNSRLVDKSSIQNTTYENKTIRDWAWGNLLHAIQFRLTTFCLGFSPILEKRRTWGSEYRPEELEIGINRQKNFFWCDKTLTLTAIGFCSSLSSTSSGS